MTDDELADALAPLIKEAHDRIEAHEGLTLRTKRKARLLHNLAEELRDDLRGGGIIQPFSGGDPKEP